MTDDPIVLGIETSCDETAAAVVRGDRRVLGEVVLSQLDDHAPYGGVVPEIAARAHLQHLDRLIAAAMDKAGIVRSMISMGLPRLAGPGLIGGVMVGVMTAKAIAAVHGLPFLAVNHLEGHALSARLTDDVAFPFLLLLVSGGHCQLLTVAGVGRYTRLGTTVDDAVGEAFDKTAKLLDLGFPGGPVVETWAAKGDGKAVVLPRPMAGRPDCDFSFSGLKTAVRHVVEQWPAGEQPDAAIADLCASFQGAVADVLADRTSQRNPSVSGRSSRGPRSGRGRRRCRQQGDPGADRKAGRTEHDMRFVAPPLEYCTDNAAMIAWAGHRTAERRADRRPRFRAAPTRWPPRRAWRPDLFGVGRAPEPDHVQPDVRRVPMPVG